MPSLLAGQLFLYALMLPKRHKPAIRLLLASVLLSAASLFSALLVGSADIPATQVVLHLFGNDNSIHNQIIDELRLPRALSAFAVGGVLALAGCLMQVLLRNPLGDPYILGISGGASFAVLLGMLLSLPGIWMTPLAFLGAITSMLLVFALGHNHTSHTDRLLLTGVVVAAGWSAAISLVLSISPPMQLPGMLFWLMGDLGDALSPYPVLGILLIGLILALWLAPQLNLAVFGLDQAAILGVKTQQLRWQIYFLASLLTAAAVSIAGAIGFVGLITPHLVRLFGGQDHRILVPVSTLLGGSLLTLADTVARTIISPMQLPVGVLTAVLGVPVFLWLLYRKTR